MQNSARSEEERQKAEHICELRRARRDGEKGARADGTGSGGIGGRAEEAAGAAAAAAAAAAERDGDVSARVQVERDEAELKSHDT